MQAGARRRITAALIVVAALVATYALAGFFLAPYLAQRQLARYAEDLGRQATAAELRFNPFTYTLEAKSVTLKEKDGRPIAAIERLYADFDFVSLLRRPYTFSELAIEGADITAEIDRNGKLNLAQLTPRSTTPAGQPQTRAAPRELTVRDLKIDSATVHYADHTHAQPLTAAVGPVTLHATELTTVAGKAGNYTLTSGLPDGASLTGKGTLSLQPLASAGDVHVADVKLASVWPFVRERLRIAQPRGTATLQAAYRYEHKGGKASFSVSGADVQVKALHLALAADRPLLDLASAHAKQAHYDSATGTVVVPSLELANGR
jgi:uncharacterized protein involved in outer membrane biogenesis